MEEIWKQLAEFPKYEISTLGNVRHIRKGNLVKSAPDKDSYLRVRLMQDGPKPKNRIVHRLLAQTFIPNPENKPEVNHKDGNKRNNSLENLEWNTKSENRQHAFDNGLQKGRKGTKHHNCKLTEDDVVEIKRLVDQGLTRPVIAKVFGIHKHHIYRILKGIRWGHKL